MSGQLGLFEYQLSEFERSEPPPQQQQVEPIPAPPVSWRDVQSNYYLVLIGRFMRGKCPKEVRFYWIERLQALREELK